MHAAAFVRTKSAHCHRAFAAGEPSDQKLRLEIEDSRKKSTAGLRQIRCTR